MNDPERIWIASEPGTAWSTGPSVISDRFDADGKPLLLAEYSERGWEIAVYVLEPEPPRTISGRARRFADQCSGCYPQVTETGPCICADEMAQEPPDASWREVLEADEDALRLLARERPCVFDC